MRGGAGNDTLQGGAGKDVLTGDAGRDVFVFDTKPNKRTNIDKIIDFNVRDDTIHLAKSVFTKIAKKGVLAKSAFWSGHDAKDSSDRIGYDKKTGECSTTATARAATRRCRSPPCRRTSKGSEQDFFVV